MADQRRQAVCDAAPGRQLLPPRRQLLDDPRRASRSVRAGRVPGGGERRHRQLGDIRERHRARGRRRDGPRRRRQAALGADGAHHQGRHVQAGASLLVSADRGRRGEARLHQPRGARRDRARLRGARHGAGADVRRVAGAHGRAAASQLPERDGDSRHDGSARTPADAEGQRGGHRAAQGRSQAHPRAALHRAGLRSQHLARDVRHGLARPAHPRRRRRLRSRRARVLRPGRGAWRRPGAGTADRGGDGGAASAARSPRPRCWPASASCSRRGRRSRTAST